MTTPPLHYMYLYGHQRVVRALDVLVWDTEEESEDDDGAKAAARYLIRDKE